MLPSLHTFDEQVLNQFGFLQEQFGFWGVENRGQPGRLRLESDRYFIEFAVQPPDSRIVLYTGRAGQPPLDLAWIFAYLTRGLPAQGQAVPVTSLYFSPLYYPGIQGAACFDWQLTRLKEILQPLWPAIFIFLDMDGPNNKDFQTFYRRGEKALSDAEKDGYHYTPESQEARLALDFVRQVNKAFTFLGTYGYQCVHSDPILVRYEKQISSASPAIYISVFHRVRSFQVGVHTGWKQDDPIRELNFDMNELASWSGKVYHPQSALSNEELRAQLNRLSRQFRSYAAPLLADDTRLFDALLARRIDAASRISRLWASRNR
ncbi:MAG: hypothetical protein GX491_04565 [Chloroflexi bacterium]|nr:hypothetical protein [Chloroflexota bacterium]